MILNTKTKNAKEIKIIKKLKNASMHQIKKKINIVIKLKKILIFQKASISPKKKKHNTTIQMILIIINRKLEKVLKKEIIYQ